MDGMPKGGIKQDLYLKMLLASLNRYLFLSYPIFRLTLSLIYLPISYHATCITSFLSHPITRLILSPLHPTSFSILSILSYLSLSLLSSSPILFLSYLLLYLLYPPISTSPSATEREETASYLSYLV